jgi:hypothetical protein
VNGGCGDADRGAIVWNRSRLAANLVFLVVLTCVCFIVFIIPPKTFVVFVGDLKLLKSLFVSFLESKSAAFGVFVSLFVSVSLFAPSFCFLDDLYKTE